MTSENQKRDPRKGPWPVVLRIALTEFVIAIGILVVTAKLGIFDGKGVSARGFRPPFDS